MMAGPEAGRQPRRAVLLDRDGTLIVEKNYLHDPAEVVLETGVVEALARLRDADYHLIVVTNQSGVGRGYFTEADVHRVHDHIATLLRQHGITVAGWYMCPHAPDVACDCRKPRPGMALAAAADHGLDLAASFVIGDKMADVGLADAVGAKGILVTTGHGREAIAAARASGVPVCATLLEAAEHILGVDASRIG